MTQKTYNNIRQCVNNTSEWPFRTPCCMKKHLPNVKTYLPDDGFSAGFESGKRKISIDPDTGIYNKLAADHNAPVTIINWN